MVNRPDAPADARTDARTLEDPVEEGHALASSAFDCRPDVCQLGDTMSTWSDLPNAECPRCGFATIDMETARARRPSFDFPVAA
jgi:hypothetical protein